MCAGEGYVKVVLHNNHLVVAMLVGKTDLEETFENLALNQTDFSTFNEHLHLPDYLNELKL